MLNGLTQTIRDEWKAGMEKLWPFSQSREVNEAPVSNECSGPSAFYYEL